MSPLLHSASSRPLTVAVVVPCYNEAPVLNETVRRLTDVAARIEKSYAGEGDEPCVKCRILLVDDGSRDATWTLIEEAAERHEAVGGLRLAHNAGHQNALWAGLEWAAGNADAAVSIDADLQDDVEAVAEMVRLFAVEGSDVVYGVRRERITDTWFKRTTALAFYKLMNNLGGSLVNNHADFRLLSKRALAALMAYPERNLFLRGMVRTLGFKEATVCYDRAERFAGESKYPLSKMLSFAFEGITSFSTKPLRFIFVTGQLFILVSLGVIVYALVAYLQGEVIAGWTSLLISLWFIGGILLTALGIIGEYVGKIYREVKRRPRYIVMEKTRRL